jgi:multidrug efflux pump subunit AcrA (membrane-fusion protein)
MQQLKGTEPRPDGSAAAASDEPLGLEWLAAPKPRRRRRWWLLAAGALAVLLAAGALLSGGAPGPAPTPGAAAPAAAPYDARGKVVPATQARVTTLQGGVVRSLRGQPGTVVADREELARIETPSGGVEVLVAPFTGTLLSLPVQVGDGLMPGSPVAVVGDLTSLRIETTDVDEYLIGTLRVGQPVEATVDALGAAGRAGAVTGRVLGITLLPEAAAGGDAHYPVLIQLDRTDPGLRPGMSARLRFGRGG